MEVFKEVIVTDSIDGIGTDKYEDYLAHALCCSGKCSFTFNNRRFELSEGELMIVRNGKLLEDIECSPDFSVKNIYVTASFIELCTPQTNYGMKGQLALFLDPVMKLDAAQRRVCEHDFQWIEYRLAQSSHRFYREQVMSAVQSAILDFFDIHSSITGDDSLSTQNAIVMSKFLRMLEAREYRANREVTFYADALCVTPKYLSEVSKKVSGYSANFWINRYTTLDIARMLRNKSLTILQISDMFNFSSTAYFSRYVQRNLGLNPSQLRD